MHCCFDTSRLSESKYVHSEIDSSTSNNKEKTRVPIFGILVFFIYGHENEMYNVGLNLKEGEGL